jgi:Carboxypeptidase regulatory-like domain
MTRTAVLRSLLVCCFIVVAAAPVFAQQSGSISGTVSATDGAALPGVTVEARSNVLPQPRVTTTLGSGDYRLPALLPGDYTVTFTLSGMQTATRKVQVLLGQDTNADVKLGVAGVSENITVEAQASLVSKESTALNNGLSNKEIQGLPVAQEYRDLMKLIPGVMYTQDTVRGPSAGASGQDNVYLFDGVNVTMPLFGVLVAEPSTHDVAEVNVIKGGAKAIDFDRAAGFLIDAVSKSGTNKFSGMASYQVMNHGYIAEQQGSVNSRFQQDRKWSTVNFGGPIWADHLFFYGSYYKPDYVKGNQSNLYGALPEYTSKKDEEFLKLTFNPTQSWLINGSYRQSHRKDSAGQLGSTAGPLTGQGSETHLKIGTLEGSKLFNDRSYGTFKFTDFKNPGGGRPVGLANVQISTAPGTHLDINNLDQLGRLTVPTPIAGNAAQNAFVAPYITKYGYLSNGVRTGGGTVGFYPDLNDDDSFFRRSGQIGYNYTLGTNVSHDLHFGYQRYEDSEDLFRTSNGWGSISIPGGSVNCPAAVCGTAKPAFFQAVVAQQSGATGAPVIHSEFHSQNVEFNDSIHMKNWTFNAGVMLSNDTLYGQGLKKADNVAGFVSSPGTKYKMKDVPFKDHIQPRLGATWAYNGVDTVFTSYARYDQAANSDARAASWDRNLVNTLNVYFDASGNLLGIDPVKSSAGKLFQAGIKPPRTNEFLIGTSKQMTPGWSTRLYGRYRKGSHFWEDTQNGARVCLPPYVPGSNGVCGPNSFPTDAPSNVPHEYYIPDLPAKLAAIGSGSTYVIAELDGAFTKYLEATVESDYRSGNFTAHGSYTWSHYYGNFDQDNTSVNTDNDASRFIGSSNIGDGAGRQVWNNKYGDLRGDRRNVIKLYGTYALPWKATTGAFFLFQSGQPYELLSYLPYKNFTTSTSDTNRYLTPAGGYKTGSHNQLDLNYTQNFPLPKNLNFQIVVDLFNALNNQSAYNFEPRLGTLGACNTATCISTSQGSYNAPFAKSFYDPARFQVAARLQF